MMKSIALVFLFLVASLASPVLAQGKRIAVVVGISNYEHFSRLDYAADDAQRIARSLKGLGYSLKLLAADAGAGSVERPEALKALREIIKKAQPEDTVLFYFAGHGSRPRGQMRDYLLFTNTDPEDIAGTALPIDSGPGKDASSLEGVLAQCRAKNRILIIDACRNTTRSTEDAKVLQGQFTKDFKDRLDRVVRAAPPGVAIRGAVLYACAPGEAAKERANTSGAGGGGVFTTELVQILDRLKLSESITMSVLHQRVAGKVSGITGGRQNPARSGDDILLGSRVTAEATVAAGPESGEEESIGTRVSRLTNLGFELIDARKFDEGEKLFLEALKLSDTSIQARNGLSLLAFGRYEAATEEAEKNRFLEESEKWATRVIEADERDLTALRTLAAVAERRYRSADVVKWYRKAAEAGDSLSMALLGVTYELGPGGVVKDENEAVIWHRRAAEAGEPMGMHSMARMHVIGRGGITKSLSEAMKWFRKAADAGYPQSMVELGLYCEAGDFLDKNEVEAVTWFRKAAELDFAPGMYELARMYGSGRGGLTKNVTEAERLYRRSAEAGERRSMVSMGIIAQYGAAKNDVEAVNWYRKALAAGEVSAARYIGNMYRLGAGGLPKDPEQAAQFYRKGASLGDILSMVCMGDIYRLGEGVSKDMPEAVTWYRKAADLGNTEAMWELGLINEMGFGLTKNPEEAMSWHKKSAEGGDTRGMIGVGRMYQLGHEKLPKDNKLAIEWFRKAADAGDANGMACIGYVLLEGGHGVDKQPAEAVDWFRKAAEAGDSLGMYLLGFAYESGTGGIRKDKDEAKRWYRKSAELGFSEAVERLKKLER